MKINGKIISGPSKEVVVIPRGEEEFVIQAQAVLDYTDFDKLCPRPNAPQKMLPGGEIQSNVEDPTYRGKLDDWSLKRTNWMMLQSLQATEGLEWSSVMMDDPDSWNNFHDELSKTFSITECNRIYETIMTACGLNQKKIDEATKRFLATQAVKR